MTGAALFGLILVVSTVVAAGAIIAIASRRSDSDGAVTTAELDRKAAKVDRERRKAMAAATTVDAPPEKFVPAPVDFEDDPPQEEITETEYGVTRRKFFNRAITAIFGLYLLQFALAGLAFFWPKLKGGFGTAISAGRVDAIKAEVIDGSRLIPKFVPAAQSWVVPFPMSELPGSSFEATPFVVAGGESDGVGLMALWQRCVHLGCRVPSCESSQGFECPCHGSKYNGHGEYASGPAPRNLDRFAVGVNAAGEFIIDTGTVVQSARAKQFTITYPQGPFCVG